MTHAEPCPTSWQKGELLYFEAGGTFQDQTTAFRLSAELPWELAAQTWRHLPDGREDETELSCTYAWAATLLCSHQVKCKMDTETENAQLGF